ncbi:hypothetical protein FBZ88_105108 [Nitrospirillum bahiense]|uniref:Uncharacterized protein n=1 Tax=Nitrospirillum amazonense TaxID=28077 RepID=A0A560G3F0_9PROT|nr:hypothetical protein FBZ88_105108 [Nitrospirillum amazonense]
MHRVPPRRSIARRILDGFILAGRRWFTRRPVELWPPL